MSQLTLSLHGVHPYPMLVVALRRITGLGIGQIAAALSKDAPLFDETLAETPTADQLWKIQQLLQLFRVAAVTPVVVEDGRAIDEQALQSMIEAAELMQARDRGDGGAA